MRQAKKEPEARRIPILRRALVGPDDARTFLDVFCPSQEKTVAAERCAECAFLKAFPRHTAHAGASIECAPPAMTEKTAARLSRPMDLAEAAARTPLGELVRRRIACVTEETSLDTAVRLMTENAVDSLPVVSTAWGLVGIVSKADVVRARYDRPEDDGPALAEGDLADGFYVEARHDSVGDVMTRSVHTLPEDARLSHAMSLMAAEDVQQVPVLTSEGALVGVITSLDCVRWIARQMGYVVPWHAA
jgi:CBS domain-containing protein